MKKKKAKKVKKKDKEQLLKAFDRKKVEGIFHESHIMTDLDIEALVLNIGQTIEDLNESIGELSRQFYKLKNKLK